MLRDYTNKTIVVQLKGHVVRGIPKAKGGTQGGVRTPKDWTLYLDAALEPALQQWISMDLGLKLETNDGTLLHNHALWVDDIVNVAHGKPEMQNMLEASTRSLLAAGLTWKASSLEVVYNRFAKSQVPVDECLDINLEIGRGFLWVAVNSMEILGVTIDSNGSTATAVNARLKAAWEHWYARQGQLCRGSISLKQRVQRFYQTVLKTLLWGARGWIQTQETYEALAKSEKACWRKMLLRRRQDDEDWPA